MTEGESKKKQSETKSNGNAGTGKGKGWLQQHSQGQAILNSDNAVPMLKYGAGSNYDMFNKQVAVACVGKYKTLGRLIVDEKYYVPPPMDATQFDLSNDPYEIKVD
jgi:hypothetical protein